MLGLIVSDISLPYSPRFHVFMLCVVLAKCVLSDVAAWDLYRLSSGDANRLTALFF